MIQHEAGRSVGNRPRFDDPQEPEAEDSTESLSLAIIWNRIQTWISEGFYPPSRENSWKPRKLHLVASQAQRQQQLALASVEGDPDL